jgi:putative ATPase
MATKLYPRKKIITEEMIKNATYKRVLASYKKGDTHYDVISAFIKSLRGSDPDAAIYWLARMIEAGEDPKFIARRMVIFASEDIGNAAPMALVLAVSTFEAVNTIGLPEARINLSQCVTYLASAPKSNASYLAIDAAISDVQNETLGEVPGHLRNAPTKFAKAQGYGKDYKYPHQYDDHWVVQDYLPSHLKNKRYYQPTEMGAEKEIKERLKKNRDKSNKPKK